MPYNIDLDLALPKIRAAGRKQVFEILATEIGRAIGCAPRALYDVLSENESHEPSGMGNGVAIPHLKLPTLPAPFLALATLDSAVDFNALDGKPVDIVCVVLSPAGNGPLHLRELSRVSRLFNNKELRDKIRDARDSDIMARLFTDPEGWLVAA